MKIKHLIITSALSCASLNAAVVTWNFSNIISTGTQGSTTGTGFLDTSDTFVYAENTGGSAATLDGINFVDGTIAFSGGLNFAGFHSNATNSPISSTGAYGGNSAEGVTIGTGGVGGPLILGNQYRVQLLIMDGRGSQSTRTFQVDGIDTDHAQGTSGATWGPVLLATGTFIADADSQFFFLEVRNANDTSAGAQLNGLVLHTSVVPEPSSVALLGLGGLALLRRRR